jgi:uncharacterized protein
MNKLPIVPNLQQRVYWRRKCFKGLHRAKAFLCSRKSRYRDRMIPGWFAAAFVPMIASQIVRLHQHDAASWLLWDYAGRLGGLAVLAAIPSARAVAFRRDERRLPLWKIALWIAGVLLAAIYLIDWTRSINAAFPMTVFGSYPRPNGWLRAFDLVLGLALVAFNEEIIFRRCAGDALQHRLHNGWLLVLSSSLLFGCYHWWTGLGHVIGNTIVGVLFMLFYRRSGALWPVVLAHYLTDLYFFM